MVQYFGSFAGLDLPVKPSLMVWLRFGGLNARRRQRPRSVATGGRSSVTPRFYPRLARHPR
jgi:hypothetical protein